MTDPVSRLVEAIDRKDAAAIRAVYAPEARFFGMTPNTFQRADGADAVAAKVAEWFTTWEEDPSYAFLGTVRDGERAVVEFERTSTFEGAGWVRFEPTPPAREEKSANGIAITIMTTPAIG